MYCVLFCKSPTTYVCMSVCMDTIDTSDRLLPEAIGYLQAVPCRGLAETA